MSQRKSPGRGLLPPPTIAKPKPCVLAPEKGGWRQPPSANASRLQNAHSPLHRSGVGKRRHMPAGGWRKHAFTVPGGPKNNRFVTLQAAHPPPCAAPVGPEIG